MDNMDECPMMTMIDKLNEEHDVALQENVDLKDEIHSCEVLINNLKETRLIEQTHTRKIESTLGRTIRDVTSLKKENKALRQSHASLRYQHLNLSIVASSDSSDVKRLNKMNIELSNIIKKLGREDLLVVDYKDLGRESKYVLLNHK